MSDPPHHITLFEGKSVMSDDDEAPTSASASTSCIAGSPMSPLGLGPSGSAADDPFLSVAAAQLRPDPRLEPEESVSIFSSVARERRDRAEAGGSSASALKPEEESLLPSGSESVSIISSVAHRRRDEQASGGSGLLKPMDTATTASESFSFISSVAHNQNQDAKRSEQDEPVRGGADLKPMDTSTTASESFSVISSVAQKVSADGDGGSAGLKPMEMDTAGSESVSIFSSVAAEQRRKQDQAEPYREHHL